MNHRITALLVLICLLAIIMVGCAMAITRDGLTVAAFGSVFHQSETFQDGIVAPPFTTVTVADAPDGIEADDVSTIAVAGDALLRTRSTVVGRSYGTSQNEWETTPQNRRGSLGGDGMSDNLRGVIGDDAAAKIAEAVIKGINPVGTAGGGAASRLGDVLEE